MVSESSDRTPRRTARSVLVLLAKVAVTGLCFWYLMQSVDMRDVFASGRSMDPGLTALACLMVTLHIPLVGLRWAQILDRLTGSAGRAPLRPIIAVTAITSFFSHVLPNLVGESMRVWLLARLGYSWRQGLVSVILDRGVGVGALVAVSFLALLLPTALTALGGYREVALGVFGLMLVGAAGALACASWIGGLLERCRYTRWPGRFAGAVHRVLLGSPAGLIIAGLAVLVHGTTIAAVWLLAQAQGLSLTVADAAVLFAVMISVAMLPISVGGWGLRELAVAKLLAAHGYALEQALFFSISFGLVLIAAMLPGAIVWPVFRPERYNVARSGALR